MSERGFLAGETWQLADGRVLATRDVFLQMAKGGLSETESFRAPGDEAWRSLGERFRFVGRYGVLHPIGEGSFGKVFLGFDASLREEGGAGRLVAIKRPSEDFLARYANRTEAEETASPGSGSGDARSSARRAIGQLFSQEALLTARLALCPYVVAVLDHDVDEPYLVLEYCDGGSLRQRLAAPYTGAEALRWSYECAAALRAAHSLSPDRLIHRDLKPANILLAGGHVKLSDFGGAQMMQADQRLSALAGGFTPIYAAPEAFDGAASPATDIWSLGVLMYELAAGRRPFEAEGPRLTRLICEAPAPPLPSKGRFAPPVGFAELVSACLSKAPEDRPGAAQLAEALDSLGGPFPPPSGPVRGPIVFGPIPGFDPLAETLVEEPAPPRDRRPALALVALALLVGAWALGAFSAKPPPLSLSWEGPADGALLTSTPVRLRGEVRGAPAVLSALGRELKVEQDGPFDLALDLPAGAQVIELLCESDSAFRRLTRRVTLDLAAPSILLEPFADLVIREDRALIRGRVRDDLAADWLTINGQPVTLVKGRFAEDVPLFPGVNDFRLEASDAAGRRAPPMLVSLTHDPRRVVITASSAIPEVTRAERLILDFEARYHRPLALVRDQGLLWLPAMQDSEEGVFAYRISMGMDLREGMNEDEVAFAAEDGSRAERRLRIRRDTTPPRVLVDHINGARLSYEEQRALRVSLGAKVVFVGADRELTLYVEDEDLAAVTVNGQAAEARGEGIYALRLPSSDRPQSLIIVAEDRAGNRAEARPEVYTPRALARVVNKGR